MSNYYEQQKKVRQEINDIFKSAVEYEDKLKPKELLVYDLQMAYAVPTKTIHETLILCERLYPSVKYHTMASWQKFVSVMGEEQ